MQSMAVNSKEKPNFSFAEKLSSGSDNIFLVTGGKDNTGYYAWFYVRVERDKVIFFKKQIKEKNINLKEYGEILFSGYGETPPEEIIKIMKDKYGFTN